MCPSYTATRGEKDSTRGRARVFQEMPNSGVVILGWSSPEVHDALPRAPFRKTREGRNHARSGSPPARIQV